MARPGAKDLYRDRAKKEGYPARSVYKLKEIQEKFKLLQPGDRVVDLGCHPGSWLLYCSGVVGPAGRVLGIDLKSPTVPLPANVSFLQADVLSLSEREIRNWARRADVVLSDLSPKTSGIKWLDHQRSLDLNLRALEVAGWLLKRGGRFLIKIFEGEGTRAFSGKMGEDFETVRIHKPKSSRSESRENYFLGTAFKGIGPDSALSEKR